MSRSNYDEPQKIRWSSTIYTQHVPLSQNEEKGLGKGLKINPTDPLIVALRILRFNDDFITAE